MRDTFILDLNFLIFGTNISNKSFNSDIFFSMVVSSYLHSITGESFTFLCLSFFYLWIDNNSNLIQRDLMMINWENNLKGLGECLTHDKYWTCIGYYYILYTYGAKIVELFYSWSGWPAKLQLNWLFKSNSLANWFLNDKHRSLFLACS